MLNTQIAALKEKVEFLQLEIAETAGKLQEYKDKTVALNRAEKALTDYGVSFSNLLERVGYERTNIIMNQVDMADSVKVIQQQIKKLNKAIVTLEGLAIADGITT